MRIGIGYDIHSFGQGRTLVLGGVTLPGETGLAGHSDADVVLHAVIDALLGADSALLVERTLALVRDAGYAVENVDVTVIAEKPRLAPHIAALRARMAELIGVSGAAVSVKATTNEGVGDIGRGEAIAAVAVALLR